MFMLGVAMFTLSRAADVSNITLYRITPRNYTGVTNLDTGDPAGDAFFGLYEVHLCSHTRLSALITLFCAG